MLHPIQLVPGFALYLGRKAAKDIERPTKEPDVPRSKGTKLSLDRYLFKYQYTTGAAHRRERGGANAIGFSRTQQELGANLNRTI